MYERILVATDGSTLSKKAVNHAIDLAAESGAELLALYVVPRYPVNYFEGGVSIPQTEISRIEKQWAERGHAVVEAVASNAKARGVKVKGTIATSDLVAESIIAAAKKNKADLVVMASHGRKGLKRVLLGSETQHVLTHSTVPVLVLR